MGWESILDDAKKGHRPKLKNWSRDGFAYGRAAEFENLSSKISREEESARCRIARENASTLTPDEFVKRYEATETPVLISGIVEQEDWAANRRWTLDRLKEDFRDRKFKCGEDDDGHTIKVTMRNFVKYTENQVDDSPLYVFDSHFDDDFSAKRILDDYKVPKYFPTNPDQENQSIENQSDSLGSVNYHDLFSLVGEKRRPPYRWFLMGPKRSGTCVHIDPLGSSAWNTVVSGRKLWVLFPPGTPKSIVKAKRQILQGEDDEAINFFIDLIPRLKRDYPSLDICQFIQMPGDTVFIPGGWWHAVLNLEDSVAITQNYCSKQNFDKVWKETRTGRKKMALKWLRCLREAHPHLAIRAEQLNQEDNFIMPFDKKAPQEEQNDDRGRKSKKETSSKKKKSKSKSRSKSRSGEREEVKEVNDDGRKKHLSRLDREKEGYMDIDHRAAAEGSDSDDSNKQNKRKIDKVAGVLAGIDMDSNSP